MLYTGSLNGACAWLAWTTRSNHIPLPTLNVCVRVYVCVYVCTCVIVVCMYVRDRGMCCALSLSVQETKPLGVIPLIRGEVREGMCVWLCQG